VSFAALIYQSISKNFVLMNAPHYDQERTIRIVLFAVLICLNTRKNFVQRAVKKNIGDQTELRLVSFAKLYLLQISNLKSFARRNVGSPIGV
jgi:hypothetical protein